MNPSRKKIYFASDAHLGARFHKDPLAVEKKQIRQTQCMELFIVTYQGGVLLPRNVIDGLQPLESNKYQVEFDPGRRELVSTCEKIKVLHKIIINLH